MYEGDDRVMQVNALRTLADRLTDGYTVDPEDFGGNVEAAAAEAVEYYIDEINTVMPEWFDSHDRGLLIRFVEEALQ